MSKERVVTTCQFQPRRTRLGLLISGRRRNALRLPMYPPADPAAVEDSGTVKWYNAMRLPQQKPAVSCQGPMVRIHLPPGESLLRTWFRGHRKPMRSPAHLPLTTNPGNKSSPAASAPPRAAASSARRRAAADAGKDRGRSRHRRTRQGAAPPPAGRVNKRTAHARPVRADFAYGPPALWT